MNDNDLLYDQLQHLSKQIGMHLQLNNKMFACAESCTGGLVAKVITDIPGSSTYFDCGFVTYSNLAKQQLLSVKLETINAVGAVSQAVAEQMAEGGLRASNVDICLSTTGIAGPEGGSDQKPVGLVWFGIALRGQKTLSYHHIFQGDREQVRMQAAYFGLQKIFEQLS